MTSKKIYAANIANKVTPLILITEKAYAVFRLLGKKVECQQDEPCYRFLKSALTFCVTAILTQGALRAFLAPTAPRLPHAPTRRFTEIGDSWVSEKNHPPNKSKQSSETKTKKPEEKEGEEGGEDGGRGRESRLLLGSRLLS